MNHASVNLEQLAASSVGLVMLTGGPTGYVAQALRAHGTEAARTAAAGLAECLAPGHTFVELQDHGIAEQAQVNAELCDIASYLGLDVVATNGCRYAQRGDAQAHHLLSLVGHKGELQRWPSPHGSERYMKSASEMNSLFAHMPAAIRNTLHIAEMTAGTASTLAPLAPLPYCVSEAVDADAHLEDLAKSGLADRLTVQRRRRLVPNHAIYEKRLFDELRVIQGKRLSSYFLVVHDFVGWARQNGARIGPGRGSGAGSLVAHALGIIEVDPLPFGLMFERFLNVDRGALPDLDIDVCGDFRLAVVDYLRLKYGPAHVALVSKFDCWRGRSAITEASKIMGLQSTKLEQVKRLLPQRRDIGAQSLTSLLQSQPALGKLAQRDPEVGALLEHARLLDGHFQRASRHPGGVVISVAPIGQSVPLRYDQGLPLSQYDKDNLEGAGLIKFDVLSSRALTVLDVAAKLLEMSPRSSGADIAIESIPLDDPATYQLLCSRPSSLIFQLTGDGMRELMLQVQPTCLDDIANVLGLYRPGPLAERDVFVARRRGHVQTEYPHPVLNEVLRPTYGVILYQEQVMKCAEVMAGYDAAGSDLLVRAISKKKAEVMSQQRKRFLAGAFAKGYAEDEAAPVFDLMSRFAGYGLNKSHAIAYAMMTYRFAFFLAHYPAEFLCAVLSVGDRDDRQTVLEEAAQRNIELLPVDINKSHGDPAVVYPASASASPGERLPAIRLGLSAVRGTISVEVAAAIVEARGSADFRTLADFVARAPLRARQASVVKALVAHGAFDSIIVPEGIDRTAAVATLQESAKRRPARARAR